jgi:uncharacterized protein (DUF305 family)
MNKKNTIIVVVVVALLGAGLIWHFTNNKSDMSNTHNGMNHGAQQTETTSESSTYKEFAALKGEEYDRMFLAGMIAHHQGAVDMAKLAQTQAKHAELKTMAGNIITAQEKEITDMNSWQTIWGYPATSGDNMMDHSAMGMENDMAGMTNELKPLTGDAFDKKFLELMIEHHQSAIDMAKPGAANAQHEEVKTLANAIVTDQTKEISQMQTWQKEWGYKNN